MKRRAATPRRRPGLRRGLHLALACGVGLAAALVGYEFAALPSSQALARLTHGPVHETPLMRLRQAETGRPQRLSWVELSAVSPTLQAAVVASEDARFFEHHGLDAGQIRAALKARLTGQRRLRGASTITQQVAKNLFTSGERSLLRKLREALIARQLEARLSKPRILTLYLNVAEWGDGLFGVEEAARTHLGHPARELTLAEAAALVAMLPSPRRLTLENPEELYPRAVHVLDRVGQDHLLPHEQVMAARVDLALWLKQPPLPAEEEAAPEE